MGSAPSPLTDVNGVLNPFSSAEAMVNAEALDALGNPALNPADDYANPALNPFGNPELNSAGNLTTMDANTSANFGNAANLAENTFGNTGINSSVNIPNTALNSAISSAPVGASLSANSTHAAANAANTAANHAASSASATATAANHTASSTSSPASSAKSTSSTANATNHATSSTSSTANAASSHSAANAANSTGSASNAANHAANVSNPATNAPNAAATNAANRPDGRPDASRADRISGRAYGAFIDTNAIGKQAARPATAQSLNASNLLQTGFRTAKPLNLQASPLAAKAAGSAAAALKAKTGVDGLSILSKALGLAGSLAAGGAAALKIRQSAAKTARPRSLLDDDIGVPNKSASSTRRTSPSATRSIAQRATQPAAQSATQRATSLKTPGAQTATQPGVLQAKQSVRTLAAPRPTGTAMAGNANKTSVSTQAGSSISTATPRAAAPRSLGTALKTAASSNLGAATLTAGGAAAATAVALSLSPVAWAGIASGGAALGFLQLGPVLAAAAAAHQPHARAGAGGRIGPHHWARRPFWQTGRRGRRFVNPMPPWALAWGFVA
jgi:hypothetical protein